MAAHQYEVVRVLSTDWTAQMIYDNHRSEMVSLQYARVHELPILFVQTMISYNNGIEIHQDEN